MTSLHGKAPNPLAAEEEGKGNREYRRRFDDGDFTFPQSQYGMA